MLASVLRLIGLEKAQEALKLTLEEKAQEAVDDVKGVVVRMVVVAAVSVAAAIFALLAVITGLLDLLRVDGAHLRDIPGAQYRWRGSRCDRVGPSQCCDDSKPRKVR